MTTSQQTVEIQSHIDAFRNTIMTHGLVTKEVHSALKSAYSKFEKVLERGERQFNASRACSYDYSTNNRFQYGKECLGVEDLLSNVLNGLNRFFCDSLVCAYEAHQLCLARLAVCCGLGVEKAYILPPEREQVKRREVLKYLRKTSQAFSRHADFAPPNSVMGSIASNLDAASLVLIVGQLRHSVVHEYGLFNWKTRKEQAVEQWKKDTGGKNSLLFETEFEQYVSHFVRDEKGEKRLELIDRSLGPDEQGFDKLYRHLIDIIVYYTHMAYGCLLENDGGVPDWRSNDYLKKYGDRPNGEQA